MRKKNGYGDDFQAIVSGKAFCVCVLLTVLLAFGFSTFNMAVSRDDLQGYIYTGAGRNMLASGRFTIFLIDRLTSTTIRGPIAAYVNDILAVMVLIWAAVNFCIFFRRICAGAVSNAACTVFTCIFISYPLIAELWEYIGAYRVVAFGFLFDSFALLLMYDVLHQKDSANWARILAACVLMTLACAGYESLIPVYIFCVFAALAMQVVYGTRKEKKLLEIIRQGVCYAGVLAAGLVLRIVIHKLILLKLHLPSAINGSTEFFWGTGPFGAVLSETLRGIIQDYILRSIIYFPLTELAAAAGILLVIGIVAAVRHGWSILLPGLGMYFSLIILCLVQGCVTGYRSCQVFAIFVAFTAMLIVMMVEKLNKAWLRIPVLFLCGYLCFHQADQINYFLTLNYLRSEQEMAAVQQIGTDLYAGFDMEKPVIFVGNYTLNEEIMEAASIPENSRRWGIYWDTYVNAKTLLQRVNLDLTIPDRRLTQTVVNSVIDFGMGAFEGNQEAMQRLFAFAGFSYVRPDCIALQPEAEAYIETHSVPGYPKDGYIRDAGAYIIVHLG